MAKISPATAEPSEGEKGSGVQVFNAARRECASSDVVQALSARMKGMRGRPYTVPSRLNAPLMVMAVQAAPAGGVQQAPSAPPTSTNRLSNAGCEGPSPPPTGTVSAKP